MFLHSGASLHGHEYSSRLPASSSPQAPQHLRSPLLRSAFVPPTKTRVAQAPGGPRSPPVLRHRPVSDYIPGKLLTPEPVVRFLEAEEKGNRQQQLQQPLPVMPEDSVVSESELSEAAPSIDGAVARSTRSRGRRRRRREPHKTTRYFLGYPAPKRLSKTKVIQKVLPRLLLQLQIATEDGRSRPIMEAFPSSRIAGPVIAPRLAKRFPGIFGVKRQLSYDDIVLVRRDDGDSSLEADSEGDEGLETRKLLAVYSPLKHSDEAEIVLDDGSVWVATPRANGSYDFIHVDAEGNTTTARWARRSATAVYHTNLPAETCTSMALPSATPSQSRFTFSMINPLSRRHPVMATLTQTILEVQDTYTSVSSSYGRYPPNATAGRTLSMNSTSSPISWISTAPNSPSKRSFAGSTTDGESDSGMTALILDPEPKRTAHPIDDATKMLISVTALWIALRSGWSPNHTPSNGEGLASPTCTTRPSRRNTWSRATSEAPGRTTPQPSEAGDTASLYVPKRYSMPLPCTDKATAAAVQPASALASAPPSRSTTPVSVTNGKSVPRRATSTGAAFMQRHIQMQSSSEASEHESGSLSRGGSINGRKSHHLACRPSLSPGAVAEVDSDLTIRAEPQGADRGLENKIGRAPKQTGIGGEKEDDRKGVRSRLVRWIHKLGAR
ncbi:hypothetical protein B0T25DRAFT_257769 [Lasiosphaeria hispida]|uniref:Uncharacterized protein n=1 Tax=Lasiosphaeria hispida TaxID=260671 RepID=A0AAJ0HFU1_9PEZI|nr:hypothetical protein B0T25DRAFT_257769 [Lasiosphaeria hispida]